MIPRCTDFASAVVVDTFDDMLSTAGLTNHLVVTQVEHDVTAIRSLTVPPLASAGIATAKLYLNGRLAESYGCPVSHQWFPDRHLRSTTIDGVEIASTTFCPVGAPAVAVRISVRNPDAVPRQIRFGLWVDSTATDARAPWLVCPPPARHNRLEVAGARRIGRPDTVPDDGVCLQGLVDADGREVSDVSGREHLIECSLDLPAGGSWEGGYVMVLGGGSDGLATAEAWYARITADLDGQLAAAREYWDDALAAMFTPGNDQFGGSLPVLETSNEALRTLYWWGALGVLYFRRDNPASVLGRTYDTLMPANWQTTTFIWDYSLSSQVHALLDPGVMQRQIAHWVNLDIDHHFGTEWLTGGPVGYWYSVNQYALTRLVADYVRFSGDVAFLERSIPGKDGQPVTVGDHVRGWAWSWQGKRRGSDLADYGEIDNLLECVSTYIHEVASLNAANVWVMRTAAELSRLQGREADAVALEQGADELLPQVLDLYHPGSGHFVARFPDGSRIPTTHCYDYATVGTTIAADLPEHLRTEMVRFFDTELRTENWMSALSPYDTDAGYSLRPDHQWNGAYPAWPPDSARATIALGRPDIVAEWIPGLARSANQGPPGQAHFIEAAVPGIEGGARKAPNYWPYISDWTCSSAGSYCELVIQGVFGLSVGVDGELTAEGHLDAFDPAARLRGVPIRGRLWDVDAEGIRPSANP
ncbi:MAG: hypothetical protein LCH76_00065 [Actinobacteria bacterium]|nr:hypothetical protein [Actinomycetota bacterium]